MRIAIAAPRLGKQDSPIEAYFQLQALESILPDCSFEWLTSRSARELEHLFVLGSGFLESGFWDEWILEKNTSVTAIGVSLDPESDLSPGAQEKLKMIGKKGGVSFLDEPSLKKGREFLSAASVSLGGSPTLFLSEDRLVTTSPYQIYCPGLSDPAFARSSALYRFSRRFYSRLNRSQRALFFVQEPAEFALGARVGSNTLYEPCHPQVHLKALASAKSVIGFHPSAILAAVACGVPAVLLGNDRSARRQVEAVGIPFLEINPNTDPAELEHRAEEVIRKYPWENIQQKSAKLRGALTEHLKELGFRPKETKKKFRRSESNSKTVLASLVGNEDFASFVGLFENLNELTRSTFEFHVLALDLEAERKLKQVFSKQNVLVYRTSQVWDDIDMTSLLTPSQLKKFQLKPRFLRTVLDRVQAPVFYCDPGLYFYRDPVELQPSLEPAHTLLIPRFSDDVLSASESAPFDTAFCLVSPGSSELLDWWSDSARVSVEHEARTGCLPEPGFLSMAPVLFPGIRVYRDADHGISHQSEKVLGLSLAFQPGKASRLIDERGVGSVRWSGERPNVVVGVKTSWDGLAHFSCGHAAGPVPRTLLTALSHQHALHWRYLAERSQMSTLLHQHVPLITRWLAEKIAVLVLGIKNLYASSGTESPLQGGRWAMPTEPDARWVHLLRRQIFAPIRRSTRSKAA